MGYKAILAASAGALGCRSIMRKRAPWLRRRAMLQLPAVDCAADGRTHDPLPGWLQLHPQARRPDVHRLRARPLAQRHRLGLPRRAPPHERRGVTVDRRRPRRPVQPAGANRLPGHPAAGDGGRPLRALAGGWGRLARAAAPGRRLPELQAPHRGRLRRLPALSRRLARALPELRPGRAHRLGGLPLLPPRPPAAPSAAAAGCAGLDHAAAAAAPARARAGGRGGAEASGAEAGLEREALQVETCGYGLRSVYEAAGFILQTTL